MSTPTIPNNNQFCATGLWGVGVLLESQETQNGETITRQWGYDAYKISNELVVGLCSAEAIYVPQMAIYRERVDGVWLDTTYAYNPNDFLFPGEITQPGKTTITNYEHKVFDLSNSVVYLLGLPVIREVNTPPALIERTVWSRPPGTTVNPNWIRTYTSASDFDQLNLVWYNSTGKRGALYSRDFEGLEPEIYGYNYGVLQSINYPDAYPDLSRTVNPNGTVAQETEGGVTRSYQYDDDLRLTRITGPDDPVTITYTTNQVTRSQGTASLTETYDQWGRLIEETNRVAAGEQDRRTITWDDLSRIETQTFGTGVRYAYQYDVLGRTREQSATNAADDTTYQPNTESDGDKTITAVKNGSIATFTRADPLGRLSEGRLQGNTVSHSWSGTTLTVRPASQNARTIAYDFLGRKAGETHLETGSLAYQYDAAGQPTSITRPGRSHEMTYDNNGRLATIRLGNEQLVSNTYEPSHGTLSHFSTAEVVRNIHDLDVAARPRTLASEALEPAKANPLWPIGDVTQVALAGDPRFRWNPTPGAVSYVVEVQTPAGQKWTSTVANSLNFADWGLVIAPNQSYSWRLRQVDSNDQWSAWSAWLSFRLTGACDLFCVGFHWNNPDFCQANPGDAKTTVGSLIRYMNQIYNCQ